ncbi:hypothetical protein EBQ25_03920 [Allofranklinella schreckenbergeri]|uniref:Uncharacterized protein n=1 Tax=Allofranklinella schreckenbergeri TaxID=1076744 RepID=A0A3M6QE79_9BURK|nr:hypothetical protein EBQ25_03920 [Allofranklinella schreckenbergeri]
MGLLAPVKTVRRSLGKQKHLRAFWISDILKKLPSMRHAEILRGLVPIANCKGLMLFLIRVKKPFLPIRHFL